MNLLGCCHLILATMLLATVQQPSTGIPATFNTEDVAVLKAALERTVLAEIRQLFQDRVKEPVYLAERTVVFRKQHEPPDGRRPSTEGWTKHLESGMVEGGAVREQLLKSFELRNASSHAVPDLRLPLVILVPVGKGNGPVGEADGVQLKHEDRTRVWASVTLPGYSTNNRALVYVSYACGSLCGKGWLVALQKTSNGWRVESVAMLWIS